MGRLSKGRPTPVRYRSFKNWTGGLMFSLFLIELTIGLSVLGALPSWRGVDAVATVVATRTDVETRKGRRYTYRRYTYRFQTAGGEPFYRTRALGDDEPFPARGSSLRVRYVPERPAMHEVVTPGDSGGWVILGVWLTVLAALAFGSWRSLRRIAASWRAEGGQRGDRDSIWASCVMVILGLLVGAFMVGSMYETGYAPSEQPPDIEAPSGG